jgi:hypothetical protein
MSLPSGEGFSDFKSFQFIMAGKTEQSRATWIITARSRESIPVPGDFFLLLLLIHLGPSLPDGAGYPLLVTVSCFNQF